MLARTRLAGEPLRGCLLVFRLVRFLNPTLSMEAP